MSCLGLPWGGATLDEEIRLPHRWASRKYARTRLTVRAGCVYMCVCVCKHRLRILVPLQCWTHSWKTRESSTRCLNVHSSWEYGNLLLLQLFIFNNSSPTEKLKELHNEHPYTPSLLRFCHISALFSSFSPQQFESKLPREWHFTPKSSVGIS